MIKPKRTNTDSPLRVQGFCLDRANTYFDSYLHRLFEYFNSYTLNDLFFKSVRVPTTILTSMDDPVIPWKEFSEIPPSSYLEVVIESKGGHCGFIEDLNRSSYYWKLMEKKMG